MAAIAAAGWLVSRSRREPWPERAEIVASEAVFWGAFALFLGLRLLNPEIFWGEKPMDFSFLNTLYRTETLPPPEPWFAGSPLMYTYFGHYVVAAHRQAARDPPGRDVQPRHRGRGGPHRGGAVRGRFAAGRRVAARGDGRRRDHASRQPLGSPASCCSAGP